MINYYEILGLLPTAGHTEIKTAFRRLAKLYHPDKNPEGKEHFNKILKAYEVLSDPITKSSYDYKLNYHLDQAQRPETTATRATTKTWRFDEQELKRRQYFNEHYKKNNKTTEQYTAEVENKKSYNEYKYILFATPIAVALFLLIMKLATPEHKELVNGGLRNNLPVVQKEILNGSQLKMGDMPYASFFGGAKYDTAFKQQLTVKNETGKDVIVCLFTKTEFIRSFYIQQNYFAEVSQLPAAPLFMSYSEGREFKHAVELKDVSVSGAFSKDLKFFKGLHSVKPDTQHAITLKQYTEANFKSIDEKEFFKKIDPHHDKKN